MSRREILLKQAQELETQLKACLEKSPYEVPASVLESVRNIYRVYGRKGERLSAAAFIRINMLTGEPTDLPLEGSFAKYVTQVNAYDILNPDCLNQLEKSFGEAGTFARKAIIDALHRNVRARVFATLYSPWEQKLGRHTYKLYNSLVTLRPRWDRKALQGIRERLTQEKLFEQSTHDERFGLPLTSATATNPDMLRQWLTDSAMSGEIQRITNAHFWPRNMLTNAGFFLTKENQDALFQTALDPNWYRNSDASKGIAHIFLPRPKNSADEGLRWDEEHQVPVIESILQDPCWGNRKRLESQALILYWLVRTIKAGAFLGSNVPELAELGKPWGFHWNLNTPPFPADNWLLSEKAKDYIIKAIQSATIYLMSVQWNGSSYDHKAPSVSSWEEAPLSGGCASDTGFTLNAFKELRDLLFNPRYSENDIIRDVRSRLLSVELQHPELGSANDMLATRPYADFRIAANLDSFIIEGERRLASMVVTPVLLAVDGTSRPTPSDVKQFEARQADSSLALLAAFFSEFDDYPVRDARIRLGIVKFIEDHLMHSRRPDRLGMKRYGTFEVMIGDHPFVLFDSYLGFQFNLGLISPALVRPGFERLTAEEYSTIAEFAVGRKERHTVSLRDRFFLNQRQEIPLDALVPKKDAHDAASMAGRQQSTLMDWAAQWSIGPTACIIALAKAKLSILSNLSRERKDSRSGILLEEINQTLTRFINLCLSTIVEDVDSKGQRVIRADGTELPARFSVMEAFQVIPDVRGQVAWLPGDHTLPWSVAQLFTGLLLAEQAAAWAEDLGIEEALDHGN